MFSFSDRMIEQFVQNLSSEALHQKLDGMAEAMGDEAFGRRVAREIVKWTRPQRAVPGVYQHYRSLVSDSIEFFLSRINRQRLLELVMCQIKMDPATSTDERLLEMAKRFPTLHKLGQIIARNPNIDATVKKWLIRLENDRCDTPSQSLLEHIECGPELSDHNGSVEIEPTVLSEASVGAVIGFRWTASRIQDRVRGVFKILKPGVSKQLDEELTILEETAVFLGANRERYPLKDFKFLEVFQDVRQMLIKEIDLAAEQTHLEEAAGFYSDMEGIRIPRRLPLSNAAMTAMEYLEGAKITDAGLNPEHCRYCAAILFEALVCRPLFARNEQALFHGDPHAGNILALADPAADAPLIGLVDWSLAGRLARSDRVKTVRLIQAVMKEDASAIIRCIQELPHGAGRDTLPSRQRLREIVTGLMLSWRLDRPALIKKAFRLLEELSFEGVVFPPQLMLFRKAIFTLEGVLHDLCPGFDMDAAIMKYLTGLVIQEIPMRMGALLFPLVDRPENYPSLISNSELQSLLIHPFTGAMKFGTEALVSAFMYWGTVFVR